MIADVESLGLYVAEINNEYVTVAEEDDDMSAILYLGHANETMWVERIGFVDENGFDVEDDSEEEEEW